jgi:hypothetical protein
MPFFTRPNFEDRQQVQYEGTSITLSGNTNIYPTGQLIILSPTLDFTGTTTASTLYNIAGLSGYINSGNISALKVQPPTLLISGSTGLTTVDITGYYLGSIDSGGTITWLAPTGGGSVFTGGTGSCITDLYVSNIHSCSPLNINPNDEGNVYFGSTSAVTIDLQNNRLGIGIVNPTQKLHVSGNTRVERDFDGDVSVIVNNTNVGGTAARGVLAASAIADSGGRVLNGVFAVYGYNSDTTFAGFSDSGTGYLKNALTITLGGNNPRGDFNIGTRNPGKFLRFFAGSQDFDNLTLRGSLNSDGYWGFGQNMTGQTATIHIKGYSGVNPLKVDNYLGNPILYVTDNGLDVTGKTKTTTLQVTSGATAGYVLTALDSDGNMSWQAPTGGGSGTTIVQFTGNTSASCINDLYVTNLHGCSPIIVHDVLSGKTGGGYININTDPTFTYTPLQFGIGDPILGCYQSFSQNSVLIYTPSEDSNIIISNGGNNTFTNQYNYGIRLESIKAGSMTAATIEFKTNESSSSWGNKLTGGTLQSEIVMGIPSSDTGLPKGVMGTGLGSGTIPYGVSGFEYNPVFISTPRSYSYDTPTFSTIKNVLFGGGSDNSIYSGVTNSSLIGGSGNTINKNVKNVVVLGGGSITANTSNTVYVPDLVIKKSASVPTTSGDTIGEVGSITWDNNYIYVKTINGWGRTLLDYSW